MLASPPSRRRVGFTLIELLVVVSLIALLIGILLPALSGARNAARVAACLSGVRQLAIGVHAYAAENKDAIPRGLDAISLVPMNWGVMTVPENSFASSAIWRGDSPAGFGITDYNSHGKLLDGYLTDKRAMFCPDDGTNDPVEELAKIGTLGVSIPYTGGPGEQPYAFSSYLYRNLDQTTKSSVHDLGINSLGAPATALILDSNSTGDLPVNPNPGTVRNNHRNEVVNVGYTDGHAQTLGNKNLTYSLTPADYIAWDSGGVGIAPAYDRMLQNADAKNPG